MSRKIYVTNNDSKRNYITNCKKNNQNGYINYYKNSKRNKMRRDAIIGKKPSKIISSIYYYLCYTNK